MMPALPLHLLPLGDAHEMRRQRGIGTYRGGDSSLPFVGDATAEAYEEELELLVYAEEMLWQGETRAEVEHVATPARQAADALGTLLRARG